MASTSTDLPRWDLSRFGFESAFDVKIDEQLEAIKKQSKDFKDSFEGHLVDKSLLEAITEYEKIAAQLSLIASYLSLSYDVDLENDNLKKRKGAISQLQSEIRGNNLEWFELDVAELPEDELKKKLESEPGVKKYDAFLDELRRQRPHNLDKMVERALTVRAPYAGTRPLVSFFDKELSLMRFDLNGESVNMEVLLSRMQSSKDANFRATCLKTLNSGLDGAVTRVAALSLSSVAGSWLIENKERSYENLRSRRNLDNNCPDDAVNSLLSGVRAAGVPLCKRYYGLKKTILQQTQGLKQFRWSDRNAPIDISKAEEGKISWEAAVQMVERGYRKFSPRMAEMFLDMVNEKRIDVPATNGKKGGAYCAGVIPGVGPYQLLNFDGSKQDVATLAHESGHGCHDILAYKQGYLQYHPPLTLAETASIFGEMIVFRDLLELAATPEEQLTLLMSKIDDVVNSVVRQCSFDRFEELTHTAREKGELSAEELDTFWIQAMEEYYGKAGEADSPFDAYDDASHLWAYVPHFHHVPFYVYSYAFADLVVGTLYHSFQTTPTGFEDRLLDLLGAGGTRDFATALRPFGLDPTSPTFWEDALKAHLGGLVEEAEKLAIQLGYTGEKSCTA
eukprot:CAMPEP_0194199932 /NCGR_PEP_ID=MMETSP0156-20130528/756_1 /TAXON_ID=33649 /ORGANISM="Thalassionema nitzschioides, Strain L26-B" /LENGTH=619 /DNA_ID=CAMNT_0038924883 /DNA_START=41 /DNA_END=1900 /DNA_ORIENTATION=+